MDMFLDASKSAGMMLQQPPQQQQARSYVATSSFYTDNFSAPPGYNVARLCLTRQRRYQLLRLGFAMLSLVLLCGAAVGCVWLVSGRVGSWPDYLTQSSRRNHNQLKSALGDEAEEADLDRPSEDGRKYFASNLSTLMAGGWPPEARFHPTPFQSTVAVLNDTVYCDAPLQRTPDWCMPSPRGCAKIFVSETPAGCHSATPPAARSRSC
ncbi:hypothetical protein BOX15_Mlig013944g1 [Macrostomum lignano]|uniref:Uncharacterized protein n=1 Tax=Macrostomum lignano TaxID=282301 RepID=A0A267G304_9PLAT|nr:hypothetical protein BOX15_Mlig013944g1 [Macrostomum lignano]